MTPALIVPIVSALGPWIGGALVLGLAFQQILKAWQPFAKMKVDHEQSVIARQNERMDKLEALIETNRVDYENKLQVEREAHTKTRVELEAKIEAARQLYESKLEAERARHNTEESLSRHKVRNLDGCFKAFLWMAERTNNLPEIVTEVRRMRADQEITEINERAIALGTRVSETAAAVSSAELAPV